jgi:ligand-binding SRPBCC domain-containing protein
MFKDTGIESNARTGRGSADARPAGRMSGAAEVEIRPAGRGFRLTSSIVLPDAIGDVFEFFADAGNLNLLTPAWLRFKFLTPLPVAMQEGLRLDYRLRIRGVPVSWQSEITVWEPPYRFVDEQRRGPYRYWIHEHRFAPLDGGTEVSDEVRYAVPGGKFLHDRLVRPDLRAIFRFRQEKLSDLFGRGSSARIDG